MAYREFIDREGLRWEVWDVWPSARADGRTPSHALLGEDDAAHGWLAFRSARERRRFFIPPDGWERFSDDDLSRLLRHAVPVASER